jgi:CubicO group peptidase (beta-lactamase class C family)
MKTFAGADALIADGINAGAFPGAAVEVGMRGAVAWRKAFGTLSYDSGSSPATVDTIFDLASLTKVIATATLAMRAVDDGRIALDDPVKRWLPDWRGADRESVTIRDLLEHSSGLTAYLPLFRDYTGRAEFQQAISSLPLEYEPRSHALYSDLGYILLGFILEDARRPTTPAPGTFDPSATFSSQWRRVASLLTDQPLLFSPPRYWRNHIAPTEHDPWRGRTLHGEVHDENAWALGGAAGHAGLFGTVAAVGAFAQAVLHTIHDEPILARTETLRRFITRSNVPGSSRALGWDTMLPSSSCGTRMSPSAIGHTGFTGTSLWIDWERDVYVVLLTNRVHPSRDNNAIQRLRPAFHDAVLEGAEGC